MPLINFDIKKLKHKKWYHQRFDGAPLFLSFIAFAEVRREKRKPAGTEANVRICFFDADKADWYLDMADVKRGSMTLINLAKKDKNISSKLLSKWANDEKLFDQFFKKFKKVNLRDLSDKGLLSLFQKYADLGLKRFTSSAIIDHFALGTDKIVERMLREELGLLPKESDFTNIFSVVTAPVHRSFINQAEIELLKIVVNTPRDKKKIQAYQKKYYWTKNNYIKAQVLSTVYFTKEINNWLKVNKDPRVVLRQLQNTPVLNKQRKAALLKQYHFSPLLKTLLKISEDFTKWQDERKRATYLNIDMGIKIIKEMARRTGYQEESLEFLLVPEVCDWFKKKNISERELLNRRKKSVMIVTPDGYQILTGIGVDVFKKNILSNKEIDKIQDLRGLSASTGRVVGKIKIIKSATEINKIKSGDILVAVMTRPDYIAGMKKAAAIVTNEGGITCHAAIVSRELGAPCIIGTKIATEVFKDGELVEVDANHGWVRKIQK